LESPFKLLVKPKTLGVNALSGKNPLADVNEGRELVWTDEVPFAVIVTALDILYEPSVDFVGFAPIGDISPNLNGIGTPELVGLIVPELVGE
jgi:hypothetical protein